MKLYVPVIYGSSNVESFADTTGIFCNIEDCVHSIIEELIERDYLCYDAFIDGLEESDKVQEKEKETPSKEDFENICKEEADDVETLEDLCKSRGDSYYGDGWDFRIDEYEVNVKPCVKRPLSLKPKKKDETTTKHKKES